jgi:hypothetical protein
MNIRLTFVAHGPANSERIVGYPEAIQKRGSGPSASKQTTMLNAAREAASRNDLGLRQCFDYPTWNSRRAQFNSLAAASSQESYAHAIDEFIGWYSSEPRLAFNRSVVLRYRFFLKQKNLAPSTINVRLGAVRRLAYEAADTDSHLLRVFGRCSDEDGPS